MTVAELRKALPLSGDCEERFGVQGIRAISHIHQMRADAAYRENQGILCGIRSAFLRSIWNLQRKGYAPGDDNDVFALWNDAMPRIIERIGWKSDV